MTGKSKESERKKLRFRKNVNLNVAPGLQLCNKKKAALPQFLSLVGTSQRSM
jgi:hypothetical protein